MPHGGVRPFRPKLTCLTQLTSGPYVVQIWSRNPSNSVHVKSALVPNAVKNVVFNEFGARLKEPGTKRCIIRLGR